MRGVRGLLLLAIVASGLACASKGPRGGSACLYRAEVDSADGGSAGVRLVVGRIDRSGFWIRASDVFGRLWWSLRVDGDRVLLSDDRAGSSCRLPTAEITLPSLGVVLAGVPWSALPRLLAGRLPEGLDPPASGDFQLVDGTREWRGTSEVGRPTAWSLAEGGRLVASWRGSFDRGELTDADGTTTIRWVRGACSESAAPPELPREGVEPCVVP